MVKIYLNLFMPNGISCSYQLDQSIAILRGLGCNFHFIHFLIDTLWANSRDPDETPRSGYALFAYVPQKGR